MTILIYDLSSGVLNFVDVYEPYVGSVVQRYKGAEGGIRAVACHPNEDIVVSCGLDRYLRIHDINNKQLIHKVHYPLAFGFTDGKL